MHNYKTITIHILQIITATDVKHFSRYQGNWH